MASEGLVLVLQAETIEKSSYIEVYLTCLNNIRNYNVQKQKKT